MLLLPTPHRNLSRRSALHLSEECFALFQIGFLFPRDSVYKRKIDSMIMIAQESGLMIKLGHEVSWAMQRSATGRLLQASASSSLREIIQEERQLTTADTEGMFLLMAIGYLMGGMALLSEIVGGITNKCRQIIKRSRKSASSNWSSRHNSGVERTVLEQQEHDTRKAARRHAAEDANQRIGFGMREFNLTRRTLRELYNSNGNDGQADEGQNDRSLAPGHPAKVDIMDEVPREVLASLDGLDDFFARIEQAERLQEHADDEDVVHGELQPGADNETDENAAKRDI